MEGSDARNAGEATTADQASGDYTTGEAAGPYGGAADDPEALGSGSFRTTERPHDAERASAPDAEQVDEGAAQEEGAQDGDDEGATEDADETGDEDEEGTTEEGATSEPDAEGASDGDSDETAATEGGTAAGAATDIHVETNTAGADVSSSGSTSS